MDVLILLVIGGIAILRLIACDVDGAMAAPASSPGRHAPPPARTPGLLVESDVRGGVRGIFP